MYIRIIYLDLSNTSKRIIIIIIRKYKGIFQRSIETTPVYLLVISSFHVSRIFQKQCLITTFPCHPSSHPRHNYSSDSKSERERLTDRLNWIPMSAERLGLDLEIVVRSRCMQKGTAFAIIRGADTTESESRTRFCPLPSGWHTSRAR